jgi:hypothetical protein
LAEVEHKLQMAVTLFFPQLLQAVVVLVEVVLQELVMVSLEVLVEVRA